MKTTKPNPVDSIDARLCELFAGGGNEDVADVLLGSHQRANLLWALSYPFVASDHEAPDNRPANRLARADAVAVATELTERCRRLGLTCAGWSFSDQEPRLIAIATVMVERRRVARLWAFVGQMADLRELHEAFDFASGQLAAIKGNWSEAASEAAPAREPELASA